MLFYKYKNYALVCVLCFFKFAQANNQFSDMDCIKGSFEAKVSHKGFPFGLFTNNLDVKKKDCLITINHQKLSFIKNQWNIDICRSPVHIKYGTGSVDVLKREGPCANGDNDFCNSLEEINNIIQNNGLIFADGERENITSNHGRIYCSFLLINSYLKEGVIFSRHKEYKSFLQRNSQEVIVSKKIDNKKIKQKTDIEKNTSSEKSKLSDF